MRKESHAARLREAVQGVAARSPGWLGLPWLSQSPQQRSRPAWPAKPLVSRHRRPEGHGSGAPAGAVAQSSVA
eukprot:3170512-Alexandrium_andersonii.AAC.1